MARVGAGAFGEVYLAEQESAAGFRRKVAIKLLHADTASNRDAARRFRDEARILGRLSHRSIVAVLDLVRLGDRWAVVMDYVPGADVEQVVDALRRVGERFPAPAALEAGAAVLDALEAAWNADDGSGGRMGVIHRDIKPSNIRLTQDGEVKVLDFGVARVNLDTREAQTRRTGWIGTERYMSPERILCEGDGPHGDVYAATSTVVEMLLGRPLGRTPVLEDRHAAFVAEALAEVRSGLEGPAASADAVIEALAAGLSAAPTDRPGAGELAGRLYALARVLPGEGLLPFARRIVPRVNEILAWSPAPATGTLSEGGPSLPPIVSEPGSDEARTALDTYDTTSLVDNATPAPAPVAGRGPPQATANVLVLLATGLAALLVLTGVALGFGALGAWVFVGLAPDPPQPVPVAAPLPPEPEPLPPSEPEAAPAPEPEPEEPPPAPEVAAPAVRRPAPTVVAPAPPPVDAAPPVPRALVAASQASAIEVRCGAVTGAGSTSAVIRNFPPGSCEVTLRIGAETFTAPVTIDRAREVRCTVSEGRATCS